MYRDELPKCYWFTYGKKMRLCIDCTKKYFGQVIVDKIEDMGKCSDCEDYYHKKNEFATRCFNCFLKTREGQKWAKKNK